MMSMRFLILVWVISSPLLNQGNQLQAVIRKHSSETDDIHQKPVMNFINNRQRPSNQKLLLQIFNSDIMQLLLSCSKKNHNKYGIPVQEYCKVMHAYTAQKESRQRYDPVINKLIVCAQKNHERYALSQQQIQAYAQEITRLQLRVGTLQDLNSQQAEEIEQLKAQQVDNLTKQLQTLDQALKLIEQKQHKIDILERQLKH